MNTIKLKNKEITIECNAASPVIHKRLWNENLMQKLQHLNPEDIMESLDFIERAVYTFHLTAEKGVLEALKTKIEEEEYIMFLSGFEMMEFANIDVLSQIMEAWGINIKSDSIPKNLQSPQQENLQ